MASRGRGAPPRSHRRLTPSGHCRVGLLRLSRIRLERRRAFDRELVADGLARQPAWIRRVKQRLTAVPGPSPLRAALAGVGCGEPEPGERLAQLTLPAPRDGLEMIEDAASVLRRADIAVSDLGLRRPTLDDVFLQLTGGPPSENGAEASVATDDERPNPTSIRVPAARSGAGVRPAPRPPPRWRRLSPRELRGDITDARVVSVRNLRHFVRQPDLLVFSTIQPIMFVLLFTYVFGGAISHSLPPGVSYIDYLLSGVLVQSVTFRASMTAIGLTDDLKLGVIDRFRSMPMARSAVLIGRTFRGLGPQCSDHRADDHCRLHHRLSLPGWRRTGRRLHRARQRLRSRAELDLRVRRADGPQR